MEHHNPIGRFMVAAGAVIELRGSGKILVARRKPVGDDNWQAGQWEINYGRIAQGESVEQGLRREVQEEVGITQLEVGPVLSVWHIYRGLEETPENEVIGITYSCVTDEESVTLSPEHDEHRWVTATEALELIQVEGIRRDVSAWAALQ